MKVLLSWLRDYANVTASAEQIATLMGVRGFAVEGVERVGVPADQPPPRLRRSDEASAQSEASAKAGNDWVIDFEVTGNRPDCMSVVGMAREVATAYDVPVTTPNPEPPPPIRLRESYGGQATHDPRPDVTVVIDAPELCTRYVGAVADVTIGPSPDWMQARLTAGGVRPISNIVDITNYVMLELGQPMHAFDLAKIAERTIRVRRARDKERLRTLDDTDRTLDADMLVIADANEPIAVGGVKGGALSEITGATTTIVFEAAHFNPLSVRRTSRRMGLKTDASMRFERGTDPDLPPLAMQRALQLLHQIGAGTARGPIVDCHPVTVEPRVLVLRTARLDGLLGARIDAADVVRILERLGFEVAPLKGDWTITIPTRRVDVQREVDVIEEVARHIGFDRIPSTYPKPAAAPRPSDPRVALARRLRSVMTGVGFSEAMTFGFVGDAEAAPFAAEGDLVAIANPLSENFAVLRPSALPGLINAVAHNRRREQRDVRLFEVGNRFSRSGGERWSLAVVWTGAAAGAHWSGGARDVDFFDIKGVAERIFGTLGLPIRVDALSGQARPLRWLVDGRAGGLATKGTDHIGTLGQLRPEIAEQRGLPRADEIYVLEIDLEAAYGAADATKIRVTQLPRFPSVTRDIAILVADTLPAATIRRTIQSAAPPTLVSVREFDRYQGKGVPDGQVSLALRLTFRSADRTLTDADVQGAMDAVMAALMHDHQAVQR